MIATALKLFKETGFGESSCSISKSMPASMPASMSASMPTSSGMKSVQHTMKVASSKLFLPTPSSSSTSNTFNNASNNSFNSMNGSKPAKKPRLQFSFRYKSFVMVLSGSYSEQDRLILKDWWQQYSLLILNKRKQSWNKKTKKYDSRTVEYKNKSTRTLLSQQDVFDMFQQKISNGTNGTVHDIDDNGMHSQIKQNQSEMVFNNNNNNRRIVSYTPIIDYIMKSNNSSNNNNNTNNSTTKTSALFSTFDQFYPHAPFVAHSENSMEHETMRLHFVCHTCNRSFNRKTEWQNHSQKCPKKKKQKWYAVWSMPGGIIRDEIFTSWDQVPKPVGENKSFSSIAEAKIWLDKKRGYPKEDSLGKLNFPSKKRKRNIKKKRKKSNKRFSPLTMSPSFSTSSSSSSSSSSLLSEKDKQQRISLRGSDDLQPRLTNQSLQTYYYKCNIPEQIVDRNMFDDIVYNVRSVSKNISQSMNDVDEEDRLNDTCRNRSLCPCLELSNQCLEERKFMVRKKK